MLGIIICEDNERERLFIKDTIEKEILNSNENLNICLCADNPKAVLEYVENNNSNPCIYFLDVDLKSEMNGIELAKHIRKYDSKGYIIFITSHSELTLLTFQYKVQALDYIVKSKLQDIRDRIIDCINEAYRDYKNINSREKNMIPIDFGNRITYFNLDDILFFETTGKDHRIRLHTCDEQLEFYGALKEIEKLVGDNYCKSHRAYLVNIRKIKSIDKDNKTILMVNGEVCYISKLYLKGLLDKCSL